MISNNKFYHGDCLIEMDKIETKSVDLILCDLPYGTTQCKWDVIIPFEPLWISYNRVLKENGSIVLFGSEPFSSQLRLSNLKMFKYDWIWDKIKGTNFLNAKKQPMRNHEVISVFYNNQPTFNPQKTTGHKLKSSFRGKHLQTDVYGKMNHDYFYNSTERYPQSIQQFSTDTQNTSLHPTQKPVALLAYLVKTYTNEHGVVLDSCMGSGSTGVACVRTKRKFIGIEKDEKYFKTAVDRVLKTENEIDLFKIFESNG